MDEADRAAPEIERNLAEATRARKPAGPAPDGRCHYCEEPTDGDRRWCDAEHRDLWERSRGRR